MTRREPGVGDLLIRLGPLPPANRPPARHGSDDGGWRADGPVLRTEPGDGWAGYGLAAVDGPQWQAWLVGEVLPASLAAGGWGPDLDPDRLVLELRGSFLLLARHQASGAWHAWTDRFGTIHGYHGFVPPAGDRPARAALGTFSPAVAAVASRGQLDWEALTGWCSFGFFPGDRTQVTDVRVLAPATHTTFALDGSVAATERWWRWSYEPDRLRSYDDTVVELADRLGGVLAQQLDSAREGGLAVPISGGLDSRSTVAALTAVGRQPDPALWAFSYGWSDASVETAIGAELAAARRLPFDRFTIGPYLWDQLDRVVDATEAMSDVSPPRQVGVIDRVASQAGQVVAAHWGDVWLDDIHRNPADGLVDDVVYRLSKPGRAWLVDQVCAPHLPEGTSVDELLRSFVADGLAEVAHIDDEQFRVKAFKTDHWSHRWTLASVRTYRCGVVPVLPFYDPVVTDFLATVPSAWMAGRRLQLDLLRRTAPDLAAVTWEATGGNLFDAGRPRWARLPGRMRRAAARRLHRDPTPLRNWQVQFGPPAGPDQLRRHLLHEGNRLHDLVPTEPVEALLHELAAGPTGANGYTVSMLLTLAAWLRRHG